MSKKRWGSLGAGTLVLLFLGLIYGWSIFTKHFKVYYPSWTVTDLSMTFTISMVFFILGGFFAGVLLKKIKLRSILLLSAASLFTGFFGVSLLNPAYVKESLYILYLCYGVLVGTGCGLSYISIISTVNKYFRDMPGKASGTMMMGFGLGGITLGSVVQMLIASYGLFFTFRILSVLVFVVVVLGSFVIKNPTPEEEAMYNSKQSNVRVDLQNYKPGEMVRTAAFVYFVLWAFLMFAAGMMIINVAVPIALSFGAPAVVGLITSVANGAGRVAIGSVYDKFKRKTTMILDIIIMISGGVFLYLGGTLANIPLITMGFICVGVAYGGLPTISSTFIMSEYGSENYSQNFSICNFSSIPSAIVGPIVSSKLIEASGGSYISTFILVIAVACVSAVFWFMINKSAKVA